MMNHKSALAYVMRRECLSSIIPEKYMTMTDCMTKAKLWAFMSNKKTRGNVNKKKNFLKVYIQFFDFFFSPQPPQQNIFDDIKKNFRLTVHLLPG